MILINANPIIPIIAVVDWLKYHNNEINLLNNIDYVSLEKGNVICNDISLLGVSAFFHYQGSAILIMKWTGRSWYFSLK